jgi:hypothetical protein
LDNDDNEDEYDGKDPSEPPSFAFSLHSGGLVGRRAQAVERGQLRPKDPRDLEKEKDKLRQREQKLELVRSSLHLIIKYSIFVIYSFIIIILYYLLCIINVSLLMISDL